MADSFKFRQFEVLNEKSALKVGTDAVLLGTAMTVRPDDRRALDIGTGTGVIALIAAQRMPDCTIEAVEIDAPSAGEASANFSASPWGGRLAAHHLALSEYHPAAAFDLIFSNPPYFDNSLKNPDARESAARHTEMLQPGEIFAFASANLVGSGRLALIMQSENEKFMIRNAASFGLFPFRILRIRTAAHKPPKRVIIEFMRSKGEISEDTLTLQDGDGRTKEYAELTHDFYL